VVADVPEILALSAHPIIDCGAPLAGRGFMLTVTIRHLGRHLGAIASHYVDKVEIKTGKTTKTIDLEPQSSETLTVTEIACEGRNYQTGLEITVQARAHCNIHGWGEWSSAVTIPEFEAPTLVALATLILTLTQRPHISRLNVNYAHR